MEEERTDRTHNLFTSTLAIIILRLRLHEQLTQEFR